MELRKRKKRRRILCGEKDIEKETFLFFISPSEPIKVASNCFDRFTILIFLLLLSYFVRGKMISFNSKFFFLQSHCDYLSIYNISSRFIIYINMLHWVDMCWQNNRFPRISDIFFFRLLQENRKIYI